MMTFIPSKTTYITTIAPVIPTLEEKKEFSTLMMRSRSPIFSHTLFVFCNVACQLSPSKNTEENEKTLFPLNIVFQRFSNTSAENRPSVLI